MDAADQAVAEEAAQEADEEGRYPDGTFADEEAEEQYYREMAEAAEEAEADQQETDRQWQEEHDREWQEEQQARAAEKHEKHDMHLRMPDDATRSRPRLELAAGRDFHLCVLAENHGAAEARARARHSPAALTDTTGPGH